MERDSINTVCYLGIFILLILIFVPPIFRALDPTIEVVESNKIICEKSEILEDDSAVELKVAATYENKKIKILSLTFTVTTTSTDIASLEYKSQLLSEKNQLRNITDANLVNENTISFDFSKKTFNSDVLKKYNLSFDEQKKAYAKNGFKCTTE